jgi:uncharacterized protein with HEPN domain
LRDILDAMDKAEDFPFGLDLNAFRIDDKMVFAVIRSLEIICEAAKKIPPVCDADSRIFLGRLLPGCGTN